MNVVDKIIFQGFGRLLVIMLENNTDNVALTFDFDKVKANFKVELIELEEQKGKGE